MLDSGESRKEVIRPDFNRAVMIDFQGAKITSDVGFLLMREIDDRFKIIAPNLCYFSTCEKNWLREEDRLGDFTRPKRLQNLVGTELAIYAA